MKNLFKKISIVLFSILLIALTYTKVYGADVSVNKVKGLTATTQNANSISISWKKATDVTGYKVYVYNTTNKKYESYKSTKKTKMTISNLKTATKYQIKVRAYKTIKNKKYYGKYSSVLNATTAPAKVKNVKAKSVGINNVTITWNKVSRATGYKVYVYNKSKKKYVYYGKTKDTKLKIKKLKELTEYKIKVRAYKSLSGKQYFGSYSAVLKVKTSSEDLEWIKKEVENAEKKAKIYSQMTEISKKITTLKREIQNKENELDDVQTSLIYINKRENTSLWLELSNKELSLLSEIASKRSELETYQEEYDTLKSQHDSL